MNRYRAIEILIGLQDGSGSTHEAVRLAIEALKNRPTGNWEIHYNYWNGEECRCSVCGYDVCHPTWTYCPKCRSYNDDVVEVRGEDE